MATIAFGITRYDQDKIYFSTNSGEIGIRWFDVDSFHCYYSETKLKNVKSDNLIIPISLIKIAYEMSLALE
jgi:hypothetical protein